MADGLDYSARILIRYCLARAAQNAVDQSKEWVSLAEAADVGDSLYSPIIRFVSTEIELAEDDGHSDAKIKELEDRLKRLKGLAKFSEALSHDLRAQLENIDKKAD